MAAATDLAAHRLARPLPFLLHPIKGAPDPCSTRTTSPPLLARAEIGAPPPPELTAGAKLRRLDLLSRRSSLPSEPLVSFPVFSSSSWCPCRRFWRTRTLSRPSPASRRRVLPGATAGWLSPLRPRSRNTWSVRSVTDSPDQKGSYPLDRSTVDRWTRSTAMVHGLASALRQHQPVTVHHVALHQPLRRPPRRFCKKNPTVSKIT
jgi:hypothetical protein